MRAGEIFSSEHVPGPPKLKILPPLFIRSNYGPVLLIVAFINNMNILFFFLQSTGCKSACEFSAAARPQINHTLSHLWHLMSVSSITVVNDHQLIINWEHHAISGFGHLRKSSPIPVYVIFWRHREQPEWRPASMVSGLQILNDFLIVLYFTYSWLMNLSLKDCRAGGICGGSPC